MDGTRRDHIEVGQSVGIVQKHHQRSGEITHGLVKRILTKSQYHPHGIKVETQSGAVGRVKSITDSN